MNQKNCNFTVVISFRKWKFSCRWCGIGTDDNSNINKHENRCNVIGAPGHVRGKFCAPNVPLQPNTHPGRMAERKTRGKSKE